MDQAQVFSQEGQEKTEMAERAVLCSLRDLSDEGSVEQKQSGVGEIDARQTHLCDLAMQIWPLHLVAE